MKTTAPPLACPVCTFLNAEATSSECEICGSPLDPSGGVALDPVTDDADLAFALALAGQEQEKAAASQDDSLSQARADPMWKARHGVVNPNAAFLDTLAEDDANGNSDIVAEDEDGEEEGSVDPRAYGVEYITLSDGRIVTKHDPFLNGRQNSRHAEEHLPGMGDLSGAGSSKGRHGKAQHKEIRLPNTAYNAMKREVRKSMEGGVRKGVAQRGRVAAEQRATREGVLDLGTRRLLLSLINKGALEEVTGVVNAGKEARVFYALGSRALLLQQTPPGGEEEDSFDGMSLTWSDDDDDDDEGEDNGGSGEDKTPEEQEENAGEEGGKAGSDHREAVARESSPVEGALPEKGIEEGAGEYLFMAPPHRKHPPPPQVDAGARVASSPNEDTVGSAVGSAGGGGGDEGSQLVEELVKDLQELKGLAGKLQAGSKGEEASGSTEEGLPPTPPSSAPPQHAPESVNLHAAPAPAGQADVFQSEPPESESVGVAVKVFFTSLDQFSKRAAYVEGDSRYRGRDLGKLSKRKLVGLWCEKEFRNLARVFRCGVPCPRPLLHAGHVLLMTFVQEEVCVSGDDVHEEGQKGEGRCGEEEEEEEGTCGLSPLETVSESPSLLEDGGDCGEEDGAGSVVSSDGGSLSHGLSAESASGGANSWTPAPQLHRVAQSSLTSKAWRRCYLQTLACVRTLFQSAHLVHGDLSEYNLLLQRKTGGGGGEVVHVIDLGQAVDRAHPSALDFLRRDLSNVLAFFSKRKVKGLHPLAVCEAFATDPLAMLADGAHALSGLTYGRATKKAAAANALRKQKKQNGDNGFEEEGGGGGASETTMLQHRGGCGDEDCVGAALDRLCEEESAIAAAVRSALDGAHEKGSCDVKAAGSGVVLDGER